MCFHFLLVLYIWDCHVDTLSLTAPHTSSSQLCQSERTPVELQRIPPSGSSHFRTIERQDSFDMSYEPVISCSRVGSVKVVRPQPRTQSLDLSSLAMQTTPLSMEKNSHISHSTPSDLSESCAPPMKTVVDTQTLECRLGEEENSSSHSANPIDSTDSLGSQETTRTAEHINTVTDIIINGSKNSMFNVTEPKNSQIQLIKESEDCTVTATSSGSTDLSNPQQQSASTERSEQGATGSAPVSEGDSGIDPTEVVEEESGLEGSAGASLTHKTTVKAEGRDADSSWTATEGLGANSSEASSKVEQQDKKKGEVFLKLSHLGYFFAFLHFQCLKGTYNHFQAHHFI